MPGEDVIGSLLVDHPSIYKWFAILLVIGYALKLASQMSETVAKFLGKLGQHWRQQGERTTRSARRRSDTNAQVQDLKVQVLHLEERVATLDENARISRIREDLKSDYLTYDADWHYRNERHAASHGWQWPDPKHMTFDEYALQREAGHA